MYSGASFLQEARERPWEARLERKAVLEGKSENELRFFQVQVMKNIQPQIASAK